MVIHQFLSGRIDGQVEEMAVTFFKHAVAPGCGLNELKRKGQGGSL